MKNRKVLLFLFFLLFLPDLTLSQVSIGITNYHIEDTVRIGQYYTRYIGVVNPGSYDVEVEVYFDCDNCKQPLTFLGNKIGEVKEIPEQYFRIGKDRLYVPNRTAEPGKIIPIYVTPKLLILKEAKIYTPESINFLLRVLSPSYPGYFSFLYPSLLIGSKNIKGRIVVSVTKSTFGSMGVTPAIACTFNLTIIGMPLGSLLLILAGLGIISFGIYKKLKVKKKRRKKKG